ncbi:HEAT repeat-containing protein 6-like [Liolophura sinensis]|uniref:HEAT repeat-containing protein 6-like n=1 Tax=Liolophura sinensis TaxID=3198878 RepID=UPI003158AFC5
MRTPGYQYMEEKYVERCFGIFLKVLHTPPSPSSNEVAYCKTVISAIRGIQNILLVTKSMPTPHLGPLLAALRAFMLHGILSQPVSIPASLYPTSLPQNDPAPSKVAEPKGKEGSNSKEDTTGKGEGKKPRKKRPNKKGKTKDEDVSGGGSHGKPSASQSEGACPDGEGVTPPLNLTWPFLSTSESEFSDTEGGQVSKTRSLHTRLRQWTFGCLHVVIKVTEKKLLFSYWSSFLPDSPNTGGSGPSQTLITSALKDPSPKCRMGALSALTALFDGTKPYLAAAEDSVQLSSAFTPYSVVLGSMVKELHRSLLLSLVAENFPLTITQLIKCIATLVANVSYHRLNPGLLSRVIKQIRHFIHHRDPNIRVACLTCLGSMAALQPPLLEVCHIIIPAKPPVTGRPYSTPEPGDAHSSTSADSQRDGDSGFQSGEGSGIENGVGSLSIQNQKQNGAVSHSGGNTPRGTSGTITPVFSEQSLQAHTKETSWVIKLCIKNILPQPDRSLSEGDNSVFVEPLPVRLESLQVLANLCKGYFPVIRNSLPLLKDLIYKCLDDSEPTVRLHGSKLLNELGKAILIDVQGDNSSSGQQLQLPQALDFWLGLLNGPLPALLQCHAHPPVKAALCDCLADLGPDIFELLPVPNRMLCVTLALGLVNDDDCHVRAASVRSLGVYSLYAVLREDVSFIADSANAVLNCLSDGNLNVRAKAAWSLGNLTDALVLNKKTSEDFVEDFSDMLLLKLLTTAAKATQDNDKVRASSVRAVGNLLHYLPSRCLAKRAFTSAISEAVRNVLKNISAGTMKVRWNACYAIRNLFRNPLLPHGQADWTEELVTVLCTVVKECKNFKVRINAALALGTPSQRQHYGTTRQFCTVWRSLLAALETAETAMDFAEYKYRDSLNGQICTTIVHAASLVSQDDLDSLLPVLTEKLEKLIPHLDQWKSSSANESQGDLTSALQTTLGSLGMLSLTTSQSACVEQLDILSSVLSESRDSKEGTHEKSSFLQTYD